MAAFVDFLSSAGGGSVAGAAIGSVLGGVTNAIQANQQYKRQMRMMRAQQRYQTSEREASQSWQERMWNLYNEYNAPENQMRLLAEGGLSPDLYYSGHGVSAAMGAPAATSSGAPSVPSPAGEASSIAAAQHFSDAAVKASQVALNKSQEQKNQQETKYFKALTLESGSRITLTDAQAYWYQADKERITVTIDNIVANTKSVNSQLDILDQVKTLNDNEIKLFNSTFDAQVQRTFVDLESSITRLGIEKEELLHIADWYKSQIAERYASAGKLRKEQDKLYYETEDLRKIFESKKNGQYYQTLVSCLQRNMRAESGKLEQELKLYERYGDAQAIMDIVNGFLLSVGSALSGIGLNRAASKQAVSKVTNNNNSNYSFTLSNGL